MYSGNLNTFAGIWDRCYTLINRANNAINTMENVKSWSSESERNRLFGESYFLRAMAYYELAQVLAEFLYAPHWKVPTCRVHP